MAERGCGLGVAAEPYWVPPDHSLWAGSRCGLVAITWRQTDEPVACSRVGAGDGFVIVKWGRVHVVEVYISPNVNVATFEGTLANLKASLTRILPAQQVLVAGDFNAKSALWGSPVTDAQGGILENWAAGLGLIVLNRGTVQTCVRHRGGSIVDLTWASPAIARRVEGWRVAEEIETLSDHLFVEMSLPVTLREVRARRIEAENRFPRWAHRKIDGDMLRASVKLRCG
ncbi:uncharacterized protein [Temnothorax longispinosus]|uniref:uncharacterized protein n=1 Tax=Temnothorax longispinosus TaxID=300112 RepID=UPI003A992EB0